MRDHGSADPNSREPDHEIPQSAENRLAGRHVSEGAEADEEAGLGLCLASKRTIPVLWTVMFVGFGLLLTVAGAAASFGAAGNDDLAGFMVICCMIGPTMLVDGIVAAFSGYQVFEQGIRKRSLAGQRELRYSEIESFSFAQSQQAIICGRPQTQIRLSMKPEDGKPLQVSGMAIGRDEEIRAVELNLTPLVAKKMLARLDSGHPAAWGKHAQLTLDGIQVTGRLAFFGAKARLVQYSQISSLRIYEDFYEIFALEEKKGFLRLDSASVNFYPGLLLIEHMASGGQTPLSVPEESDKALTFQVILRGSGAFLGQGGSRPGVSLQASE